MLLEEWGRKAKAIGVDTLKETQKFTEVATYNSMIEEEKKKQKAVCAEFGEIYLAQEAEKIPDEYKEFYEKIQASKMLIQTYQEKIQTIKGSRKCPECGSEVAKEAMFCSKCGAKQPALVVGRFCPDCGAEVEEDNAFCANCGCKL